MPDRESFIRDADVVARIRAGDEAAFDAMVRGSYVRLVEFALTYVKTPAAAEDVVQDVLSNVWLKRETLVIRGSFEYYLLGAVRNRALNETRRTRVRAAWAHRVAPVLDMLGVMHSSGAIDADVEDAESVAAARLQRIRHAIDALPDRQREVFRLRVQHQLSFAEAASVMGISVRTAQNAFFRAVQFIRQRAPTELP